MKVHVSDAAFTFDLLYSLRHAAYSASQTGAHTLEVRKPDAKTPEQARLQLGFYLANWRARHPGVIADIVDSPNAVPR
jgi:hypothetical protein